MQENAEAALTQAQISSASLEAQVSSLREKVRQLEHQLEHQTAEEAQREVMLKQQKQLRLTADVCLTYASRMLTYAEVCTGDAGAAEEAASDC
jgi:hypothetical protein